MICRDIFIYPNYKVLISKSRRNQDVTDSHQTAWKFQIPICHNYPFFIMDIHYIRHPYKSPGERRADFYQQYGCFQLVLSTPMYSRPG